MTGNAANAIPNLAEVVTRRFWSKVALPDENGCMLWLAGMTSRGYGAFKINGVMFRAVRISLWIAEGAPPSPTHQAAHAPRVCHRPDCVAPTHLRWATPAENQADRLTDQTASEGEQNGRAKLSWDDVREIRAKLAAGVQRQMLARDYGVNWSQINRIAKGEHWVERPTEEAS